MFLIFLLKETLMEKDMTCPKNTLVYKIFVFGLDGMVYLSECQHDAVGLEMTLFAKELVLIALDAYDIRTIPATIISSPFYFLIIGHSSFLMQYRIYILLYSWKDN